MLSRRALMAAIALAPVLAVPAFGASDDDITALDQPILVTDLLGRQVILPRPARRIVLAEARHIAVLGLIHDDPVSLVVGWRQDRGLDAPTMAAYRQKFPQIDAIRPVGSGNRDLSVESIIALQPDLLVLSPVDLGDPASEVARQQVERAGIPVIYVDFYGQPLTNTLPSLRILGQATGAESRAEEFAEFYQSRLARITERLADPDLVKPRVFFHVHAAPEGCCSTAGSGVFNDFITAAGGRNIGAEVVTSMVGTVGLEYLLGADPDIYIATGGTHMAARGGLVLGTGVDQATAQASFDTLIKARGLGSLRAMQDGNAAGVWQLFNDSPIHIALIEFLAQRFHPTLFSDLDPQATLDDIRQRFWPVEVDGTWWITAGS